MPTAEVRRSSWCLLLRYAACLSASTQEVGGLFPFPFCSCTLVTVEAGTRLCPLKATLKSRQREGHVGDILGTFGGQVATLRNF